jgi:outer membrane protein TolC
MRKLFISIIFFILGVIVPAQDNSLSLSDALSRALENNYGILISRADTRIAGINNDWGNAGRYPVVGFDVSSLNSQDLDDNNFSGRLNAGLGLTWTIFDGFRVNLTKDKLGQLENLAAGRADIVVENTIEDVILAYYQVLLNQERLSILEKVMKLSEDRYNYEEARREFGNSVTFNVLTAKNNYLSDKAAYLSQEVSCRNSVRYLDFLMGMDSQETWQFVEPFEADTTDYVLSDLLDKMMSGNVSLLNQYINILLARNNTELSQSDYFPSLRLSAGVDNSNTFRPANMQGSSFSAYANATLSYDIYKAGQRRRSIEISRIEEDIAGLEKEELTRSLNNQLLSIYDLYNVRKELLAIAGENVEAAELNLQIADEKYRSGVINSFNYRDIQLIYLNAAYQEVQAIYNLISSQAALSRITGGFISSGNDDN